MYTASTISCHLSPPLLPPLVLLPALSPSHHSILPSPPTCHLPLPPPPSLLPSLLPPLLSLLTPYPPRLFGLTPIILTDCTHPTELQLWPNIPYTMILSPIFIFILFWLLATELRMWLFTPVSVSERSFELVPSECLSTFLVWSPVSVSARSLCGPQWVSQHVPCLSVSACSSCDGGGNIGDSGSASSGRW